MFLPPDEWMLCLTEHCGSCRKSLIWVCLKEQRVYLANPPMPWFRFCNKKPIILPYLTGCHTSICRLFRQYKYLHTHSQIGGIQPPLLLFQWSQVRSRQGRGTLPTPCFYCLKFVTNQQTLLQLILHPPHPHAALQHKAPAKTAHFADAGPDADDPLTLTSVGFYDGGHVIVPFTYSIPRRKGYSCRTIFVWWYL